VSNSLVTGTVYTNAQPNITSVGTLTSLGVNGTVTAVNITSNTGVFTGNGAGLTNINASNIVNGYGNSNVATFLASFGSNTITTTGNANIGNIGAANGVFTTVAGTLSTQAQPNITSTGVLTSLSVSGQITNANITTGANTTAGSLTGNWTLTNGSRLQATYADLAEYYAGSEQIEPGTVVEFGGDHEVQICNTHMSKLVAGIVTTDPAYVMNSGIECEYPVAIALQGRVPVKVIGPVKRGDMLVSANNGYAISSSRPGMGTVLGKALIDFNGENGIIEIMVGRT
jgi:hypothetical protein